MTPVQSHPFRHFFGLVAAISLSASSCKGGAWQRRDSEPQGEFVGRFFKTETRVMPYRLFIPSGYDKRRQYPLVLWLHGAGGSGTDNWRQISEEIIPRFANG